MPILTHHIPYSVLGGTYITGSGITASEHRLLDQLVHDVAENSYLEVTRTGNSVSNVSIWTNDAKTTKIRDCDITRSGGLVSQIAIHQYDAVGVLAETFTETIGRNVSKRVVYISGVLT